MEGPGNARPLSLSVRCCHNGPLSTWAHCVTSTGSTFCTKSYSGSDDANYLQRIIQQDDIYTLMNVIRIENELLSTAESLID